jgi:hypothetical protein
MVSQAREYKIKMNKRRGLQVFEPHEHAKGTIRPQKYGRGCSNSIQEDNKLFNLN